MDQQRLRLALQIIPVAVDVSGIAASISSARSLLMMHARMGTVSPLDCMRILEIHPSILDHLTRRRRRLYGLSIEFDPILTETSSECNVCQHAW